MLDYILNCVLILLIIITILIETKKENKKLDTKLYGSREIFAIISLCSILFFEIIIFIFLPLIKYNIKESSFISPFLGFGGFFTLVTAYIEGSKIYIINNNLKKQNEKSKKINIPFYYYWLECKKNNSKFNILIPISIVILTLIDLSLAVFFGLEISIM